MIHRSVTTPRTVKRTSHFLVRSFKWLAHDLCPKVCILIPCNETSYCKRNNDILMTIMTNSGWLSSIFSSANAQKIWWRLVVMVGLLAIGDLTVISQDYHKYLSRDCDLWQNTWLVRHNAYCASQNSWIRYKTALHMSVMMETPRVYKILLFINVSYVMMYPTIYIRSFLTDSCLFWKF